MFSRERLSYNQRNIYVRYILTRMFDFYFISKSKFCREFNEIYNEKVSWSNMSEFLKAQRNFNSNRLDQLEDYLIDKYSSIVDTIIEDINPDKQSLDFVVDYIQNAELVPAKIVNESYIKSK